MAARSRVSGLRVGRGLPSCRTGALPPLQRCRRKFTVLHGTPFEGTHLPLRTWFTALYLIAASSKGVSSVKLGQHLGIGQKTAWFLGQRIRRMMEDKDGLLRGVVEVDETYMGGKRRKQP